MRYNREFQLEIPGIAIRKEQIRESTPWKIVLCQSMLDLVIVSLFVPSLKMCPLTNVIMASTSG